MSAAIEMFDNLNTTIDEAGGSRFTWNQLQHMSVAELIMVLSTNNVKFIYHKPEREEYEDSKRIRQQF